MSTNLSALRQELKDELSQLTPFLLGLRELARLELGAGTLQVIDQLTSDYARREGLIRSTLMALDQVEADGFPGLPVRSIPQTTYDEIANQVREAETGFSRFQPVGEAIGGRIEFQEPVVA